MITHNRLYEQICSFENLLRAARRAARGKRMQDTIGRFRTDLEAELLRLRRDLMGKAPAPLILPAS
jgi:RNA-directed DNA polymerase